ncbi:MAG TPA: glutaredoxin domain-containing protein [Burkholderiales bacterium]
MFRGILGEDRIHPAVREKIARHGADIVREVEAAVAANDIVVVGMRRNPFPRKARALLDAAGIPYQYLEYGGYFSPKDYRQRLPLKMWTGWPTFPMVFVNGTFIGGFTDLEKLVQSGELKKLSS